MNKTLVYIDNTFGLKKNPSVLFVNPRRFSRINKQYTSEAVIVGNWPKVVAAYEAAKLPYKVVASYGEVSDTPKMNAPQRGEKPEPRSEAAVRAMAWVELRRYVYAQTDKYPINKKQALAALGFGEEEETAPEEIAVEEDGEKDGEEESEN